MAMLVYQRIFCASGIIPEALQALDHPHIVEVIEYFDDISSFFLVMELCTGLGNGLGRGMFLQ
jgi:serine/threonine protein kinase